MSKNEEGKTTEQGTAAPTHPDEPGLSANLLVKLNFIKFLREN